MSDTDTIKRLLSPESLLSDAGLQQVSAAICSLRVVPTTKGHVTICLSGDQPNAEMRLSPAEASHVAECLKNAADQVKTRETTAMQDQTAAKKSHSDIIDETAGQMIDLMARQGLTHGDFRRVVRMIEARLAYLPIRPPHHHASQRSRGPQSSETISDE